MYCVVTASLEGFVVFANKHKQINMADISREMEYVHS